jgi:TonB family protein
MKLNIEVGTGLILLSLFLQAGCATDKKTDAVSPEYQTYFEQIKKPLGDVWQRRLKEKFTQLHAEGLTPLARQQDCESLVSAQILPDGRILKAKLIKTCGLKPADEAALEAFNQMATLPPPPATILKNGVALLHWNFILAK